MSGKQFSLDSHLDLFHGIEESAENRTSSEPPTSTPLLEDENEEDCCNDFLLEKGEFIRYRFRR